MNAVSERTLVFGLDGFDFGFARTLASRGRMPWFSAQLQQGSFVATHASELQGSEWVNAACGVSAAHHGYLHTSQLRVGTYEEVETDARVVRTEPFYVPLATAGVNTVVVDLPVDRPRARANLAQIIDWGSEFNLWHYSAAPRALKQFVDETVGPHPLTAYGSTVPDEPTLRALHRKLVHGTRLKGDLIEQLMRRHAQWQCMFVGFGEVHKGGHFFWQYQDPQHPGYAGADHALSSALIDLYQEVDQVCARICAAAGEGANTVIVADRGMRANYRGDHLVDSMLQRLDLYAPLAGGAAGTSDVADSEWTEKSQSLAQRIKHRLPVGLRPLVRKLTGRERADWRNTQVFRVAEVGTTYLRVNLQGREPCGTVAAGAEYDALLARLEREFKALVSPATGQCPVAEVVFPQRAFKGPLQATLPDVGIVWGSDVPVTALQSPSIGRIEGRHREQRSGNHTCDGGMLVAGPGFAPGGERTGDLRELAPTLLALHGIEAPPHYEYQSMPELRR